MALKNKLFLSLILLLVLLITGCANFVTDKTITDDSGEKVPAIVKEFEFTLTFRGQPAVNGNYDYYLIISTENFRVIQPSHLPEAYFFSPGETYSYSRMISAYYGGDATKDLQNVYNDYFVSWERFIKYNSTNTFRQYTGPFIVSTNHNTIQPTVLSFGNLGASNELKLKISIPYDDIYFNFLAVDENNVLQDSIHANINFSYENGKVLDEPENQNLAINSGLDIINYKVRSYEY